jgi:hypothetical protein
MRILRGADFSASVSQAGNVAAGKSQDGSNRPALPAALTPVNAVSPLGHSFRFMLRIMKRFAAITLLLLLVARSFAAEKIIQVQVTADGDAPGYEAQNAMDGDADTIWHTPFGKTNPPPPHFLQIDLGAAFEIRGFACLPRKESRNAVIKNYTFFLSDDPKNFGEAVSRGTFGISNSWQEATVDHPRKARYVRLEALSEVNGQAWASLAELKILSPGVVFRADPVWALHLADRAGKPENELEWQYAALLRDLRQRDRFAGISNQTLRAEALICPSDRDPADIVARRTAAFVLAF